MSIHPHTAISAVFDPYRTPVLALVANNSATDALHARAERLHKMNPRLSFDAALARVYATPRHKALAIQARYED